MRGWERGGRSQMASKYPQTSTPTPDLEMRFYTYPLPPPKKKPKPNSKIETIDLKMKSFLTFSRHFSPENTEKQTFVRPLLLVGGWRKSSRGGQKWQETLIFILIFIFVISIVSYILNLVSLLAKFSIFPGGGEETNLCKAAFTSRRLK